MPIPAAELQALPGKRIAWMTKEYGAVSGLVLSVTNHPDRPNRVAVQAESCEKNCRKFAKESKGVWSVAEGVIQVMEE